MDIGHHPPSSGGGRPMNSQGVADRLAADTMFAYANAGEVPPNLVLRGHLHRYVDSRDAFKTRGIIVPSFSLLTAFTRRLGINDNPKIGCLLIYCDRGEYEVEPILYSPKRTTWQKP
jgi:hypothetical protein